MEIGMKAPVIFGIMLSVLIVSLAFARANNINAQDVLSDNPAA